MTTQTPPDSTPSQGVEPPPSTTGQGLVQQGQVNKAIPIAYALRKVFSKGYTLSDLRADIMAGSVVGIVALPLSMALAIAVGAPPQQGLYTAIFAGGLTAIFGGCKFQVTGPTAAFIVILAPIVTQYGLSGLLTAGFMAGIILVIIGAAKLGNLIRFIPYPVTTGFTTGIATVIATLQIKDILGLKIAAMPDHYHEKLQVLWGAKETINLKEFIVAACTFSLLVLIPKVIKKIPAPLIAISLVSLGVFAVHYVWPEFSVATIGSRFHTQINGVEVVGIPGVLPSPSLPWAGRELSYSLVKELMPAAFTIAMLGAIESLLSGVIADGMTGTKHEPNSELVGLGIGNIVAPFFGGIAATGALARTATNIRAGARSPIAAVTHSLIVLLAIVVLAPLVAYVPMACLAALLMMVAWNMSEIRHFIGMVKVAPKSDLIVLVTCFALTVFIDMVAAVSVGFVLAAVLFMRRMADLTETRVQLENEEESGAVALPEGVILYEINGPLFFGAAQNAIDAIQAARGSYKVIILDLGKVGVIDATGFAALEAALGALIQRKKWVVLSGPLPKPTSIFEKAKLESRFQRLRIAPDRSIALTIANQIMQARARGDSAMLTPTPAPAEVNR